MSPVVFLSAGLTGGDGDVSVAGRLCVCHVSSRCLLSAGSSSSLLSRWISSPRGVTEPDEGVAGCSLRLCCAFLVTLPSFPTSWVEEGVGRSYRSSQKLNQLHVVRKRAESERFELLTGCQVGAGLFRRQAGNGCRRNTSQNPARLTCCWRRHELLMPARTFIEQQGEEAKEGGSTRALWKSRAHTTDMGGPSSLGTRVCVCKNAHSTSKMRTFPLQRHE